MPKTTLEQALFQGPPPVRGFFGPQTFVNNDVCLTKCTPTVFEARGPYPGLPWAGPECRCQATFVYKLSAGPEHQSRYTSSFKGKLAVSAQECCRVSWSRRWCAHPRSHLWLSTWILCPRRQMVGQESSLTALYRLGLLMASFLSCVRHTMWGRPRVNVKGSKLFFPLSAGFSAFQFTSDSTECASKFFYGYSR